MARTEQDAAYNRVYARMLRRAARGDQEAIDWFRSRRTRPGTVASELAGRSASEIAARLQETKAYRKDYMRVLMRVRRAKTDAAREAAQAELDAMRAVRAETRPVGVVEDTGND